MSDGNFPPLDSTALLSMRQKVLAKKRGHKSDSPAGSSPAGTMPPKRSPTGPTSTPDSGNRSKPTPPKGS
jgi:hypothetical protein